MAKRKHVYTLAVQDMTDAADLPELSCVYASRKAVKKGRERLTDRLLEDLRVAQDEDPALAGESLPPRAKEKKRIKIKKMRFVH